MDDAISRPAHNPRSRLRWLPFFRAVRSRVVIGAVFVVGLALVAVGFVITSRMQDNLIRGVQSNAEVQARTVATLAQAGRLTPRLEADPDQVALLQVVAADGRVLAASPALANVGPLADLHPSGDHVVARNLRVILGGQPVQDYRVVAIHTDSPDGPLTVYAGASLRTVDDELNSLAVLLLAGLPVVLLAVGVVTWIVVGQALRPVEAIRAEVDKLSSTALHRRVPTRDTNDEVARLATTMNTMLGRLEEAAIRQRNFVADASHELRSPIASLRTQLEVAMAHPDRADWIDIGEGALTDADRLERLARDLLTLARIDAHEQPSAERLDLSEVARAALEHRRADRIPVRAALSEGADVEGNAPQLGSVVDNLLDNAQRHAVSSVQLIVDVDAAGRRARLEVRDDGAGIPPADRERIFERFTRLDEARARDSGGTGLGLAIARDVATAHGGTLTAEDAEVGARFVLELPLARPTREPAT